MLVNSLWDGWIILARVSQIREILPGELDNLGGLNRTPLP
jgi:hypothetical protein